MHHHPLQVSSPSFFVPSPAISSVHQLFWAVLKRALHSRCVMVPIPVLMMAIGMQAQNFTLAKVSLGMSPEQAQAAMGPAYKLTRDPIYDAPNSAGVSASTARLTDGSGVYRALFFREKMISFSFVANYPDGGGPAIQNAYTSVAGKLWTPVMPPPSNQTTETWLTDASGKPMRAPHRGYHTGSDVIDSCVNGIAPGGPQALMPVPFKLPFNPQCGVRVTVQLSPSGGNPGIVRTASIFVVDESSINHAATALQQAAQFQQQQQRLKSNQVNSPF